MVDDGLTGRLTVDKEAECIAFRHYHQDILLPQTAMQRGRRTRCQNLPLTIIAIERILSPISSAHIEKIIVRLINGSTKNKAIEVKASLPAMNFGQGNREAEIAILVIGVQRQGNVFIRVVQDRILPALIKEIGTAFLPVILVAGQDIE